MSGDRHVVVTGHYERNSSNIPNFHRARFSLGGPVQAIDEFETLPCDAYLGRMDTGLAEAINSPSSTLHILIYEGKEPEFNHRTANIDWIGPRYGSAAAKIKSIKKWASYRKFPLSKLAFVNAGFREKITVELWIVPAEASPPQPTPTLKKIRYKKGRPRGFCTDCCGV